MTGIRSSFVLLTMLSVQAVGEAEASPVAPNKLPIVVAQEQGPPRTDGDALLRLRAEDLARAASERFSEILSGKDAHRVGQGTSPEGVQDKAGEGAGDDALAPVWDWLARASGDYHDVIIARLKNASGEVAILAPPGVIAAGPAGEPVLPAKETADPEPRLGWGSVVENIREWLARANRSYRNEIVKKLVRPLQPEAPETAAEAPAEAKRQAGAVEPSAPPQPAPGGGAVGEGAEKPAAEAQAEGTLIAEPARLAEEAEAKRKAEAEAEAKLKAEAEAKRKAEAEGKAKRRAEEAEAKRKAEAEAEAKRKAVAEAKRKAEAEAEAKRKAVAEAKRQAEAEAKAKRRAEEAEAKRKAEAEAKARAEAKRLEEEAEAKRKAEVKRRAEAAEAQAKRLAAEAAAKRKAEAEAQAERLAEEAEAERKAVEEAEARRMVPPATEGSAHLQAVPLPQKGAAAESAGIAAEQGAPARAPAADEAAPKASKETVVAEPVMPKAEKRKLRLSMAPSGMKRLKKRRHKRHAARRHVVHVPRCARRRACTCYHGYRPREQRSHSARTYVVRRGDTLSGIAARFYGDGAGYRTIYRANRGKIRNANLIYPRQRLYIP